MTDTQAELARARLLRRQCQSAMTSEEADRMFARALQSEREAAAAEARRALEEIAAMEGMEGMTDYRFAERALAIANAFLASPTPQDDLEGDVKHGNAEYFRAALAHAAAEARRAALEEAAAVCEQNATRDLKGIILAPELAGKLPDDGDPFAPMLPDNGAAAQVANSVGKVRLHIAAEQIRALATGGPR